MASDLYPDREEAPCSSSLHAFFSDQTHFNNNKKHKRNPTNSSRNLGKDLEDDVEDVDDDEDEDGEEEKARVEDGEKEVWGIRNSIGLDSALDNEDEEDEYDKVAVGRENAGDRVYMKDITDYGPYLNCHNILPESFEEVKNAGRDPRANHLAARTRLQEDKAATGSYNPLEAHDEEMPAVVDSQIKPSEGGGNVKSILKRKDNQADVKSRKRVRFDPGCIHTGEESDQGHDFSLFSQAMEATATVSEANEPLPENDPRVPDYIRNPSNYVRYTFDSSSEDDESNLRAYKDFRNTSADTSASEHPECAASLPKSVTFTPQKKTSGATSTGNESDLKQSCEDTCMESEDKVTYPISIAAGEALESEACMMEEDDMETSGLEKTSGIRKSGRKYRSKVSSDDST